VIFTVTRLIQKLRFTRRGIWRMVSREQQSGGGRPRLSGVLWDTFTGSAPYRSVFWRTLHPLFVIRLVYDSSVASLPRLRRRRVKKEAKLRLGELGKVYRPGELIIRQGDPGDCMYVVQSGKVEVFSQSGGKETRLAELGDGDFFGEMALFERDVRSASVRPLGEARVLTVDRRMFMRKIHEDPSLAFLVLQRLSRRIRQLNEELTRLQA
jgi:hypothetical protein